LDIANALQAVGLSATGMMEGLEGLLAGEGVRIAHLSSPDHFVVVTRATQKSVFFLDQEGRRQTMTVAEFAVCWTGHVLHVERTATDVHGFTGPPGRNEPRARFDTLFIDKGDIVTGSDIKTVRFEYPFRNAGHAPLTIKKVHTGCSCLKAAFPDKPVPPGATGTVTLEYSINPNKQSFVHEAVVESNDTVFPLLPLRAAGNTNVLVTVSPASLSLGDLPLGALKHVFLFVRYNGEEDFEVGRATARHAIATVHATASRELAERVSLGAVMPPLVGTRIIELGFPADKLGPFTDEVVLETNVESYGKIRVPVSGRVVPPVAASPSLLNFGEVAPDDSVKLSLLLRHHARQPFRVIGLPSPTPGIAWASEAVDEGVTLRLTARGAAALSLSGQDLSVEVEVGGPRFTIEVPVFAARKPGS
jgi:hypothetical protein